MIANDDAALFLERGFGMQIGFGKNPALIVVDLINGFTDSASPLGANMDPEIDHTNALIDCFHAARLPVFFTTVSYDDDALADAGIWARKQKGLAILRTGSDQVKLDPRLHFESSDSLIVKKYASSFFWHRPSNTANDQDGRHDSNSRMYHKWVRTCHSC